MQQTMSRTFRLRLIVVVGLLSAMAPMANDMYLPAFPDVAASLGVPVSDVQLTLSSSLLAMGLGQLLYGPFSDRYGRRKPIVAGMALFIAASLASAFTTDLGTLIVLRFLAALGGAAGMVISRAMVRDCFSGIEVARVLSAMMMVFALAPVLGPVLGAGVLVFASWQWIFVALALFGAVCLVGTLSIPETLAPERRTSHGFADSMRAYRDIARNREYRVATWISGFASIVLFAYIASSPGVFMDGFGISAGAYGVLFAVNSVFLVAGGQLNMRLLKSRTPRELLPWYAAVQTASGALLVLAAVLQLPLVMLVLPLFVVSAAFGGISANAMAEALHPFPHNAASAAALVGTVSMVLGAGIAAVMAATGFDAANQMAITMFLAAAATLALSLPLRARP